MSDESTPWMRLLRELFGDDAEMALEELKRMGMDPEALAATSGMAASPAMMEHVLGQIRALVAQSAGEDVNWALAHDVARGVAAQGGDPTVSAAQASAHRAAVSRAELWLDAATDFDPSRLEPRVWSRAEWVEATLPVWRTLAGPVAVSVSRALTGILRGELDRDDALGDEARGGIDPSGLISSVSPTVCGMHMGQAAGGMAREAFGVTDLGIPLLDEARVVMVPSAIAEFADGLGIDEDQVRSYLALREAAHVRLFQAAPWLPGQLHGLVERYAHGITIDLEALEDAVRDAGMGDPAKLQQALNRGIFASHHTEEQKETLERIETLLALIEGWVDDVTVRAAAPHLPEIGALREMMRRRRATGGPAEDTFANLLSLELRPRRMRDAAALWALLASRLGPEGRDGVWSHPDLLPTSDDLASYVAWVDAYVARGEGASDEVDRELERLLGGDEEPPAS
ncbi:zinc-dependent metalloprotease [Demequina lignilytica]|uniref:Zinc-dependent metalloprotease n=1 Tax=Demequina lignilytica TaxID=3051663 RepID=A0AB35MFY2_9MICO|nr:zinc-dependent metalloprotease [Demequina sp. SYSU T0a273]MDN4482683.1 zinc-dependent metalloprotease [Demequina sp. SYSU T0a273]